METCKYGSGAGKRKPTAVKRKGVVYRAYTIYSALSSVVLKSVCSNLCNLRWITVYSGQATTDLPFMLQEAEHSCSGHSHLPGEFRTGCSSSPLLQQFSLILGKYSHFGHISLFTPQPFSFLFSTG